MGGLLFWILVAGPLVLLVCGFAYARYLKRGGENTSQEDSG